MQVICAFARHSTALFSIYDSPSASSMRRSPSLSDSHRPSGVTGSSSPGKRRTSDGQNSARQRIRRDIRVEGPVDEDELIRLMTESTAGPSRSSGTPESSLVPTDEPIDDGLGDDIAGEAGIVDMGDIEEEDFDDYQEDLDDDDDDLDEEDEFDEDDLDDDDMDGRYDPLSDMGEFGEVEMLTPRRCFRGARNIETVKDCKFNLDSADRQFSWRRFRQSSFGER